MNQCKKNIKRKDQMKPFSKIIPVIPILSENELTCQLVANCE